uniref:SH2 domain-containing protein n=1 Tax=Strongyloides venezuelensis TaxID=75913 RepID=A0A0K0G551_STRVS
MIQWDDIYSIYFTKAKNISLSSLNIIGITQNGYFIEIRNPKPYSTISLYDAKKIILTEDHSNYLLKIIDNDSKVFRYQLYQNITLTEGMVSTKHFLQFMINYYSQLIDIQGMNVFNERSLRRRIDESDVDDAYDSAPNDSDVE